jgi:alpha-ketoglutarate-dependent taurine dioxygenase
MNGGEPTVPGGRLDGPDAWRGEALERAPSTWRRELTAIELAELDAAADQLLAAGWPGAGSEGLAVALPTLGPALEALRHQLLFGRGFALLRGLPVDDGVARAAARFWAVGLALGTPVVQNGRGHLLGHVCDLGKDAEDPSTRLYQTNQRQGFHTDSADLVALLCLRQAQAGGDSALVSAAAAYNEVLRLDPALAAALFRPVPTDHRNEEPPGSPPWFEIPVLSMYQGALSVIYQRRYIDSTARFAAAPKLDATQRAALDLFDRVLEDPALQLRMRLVPGDLQLVHNHQLLHDRTAFHDAAQAAGPAGPAGPARDDASRRHLLRLWLCPPIGRSLPPAFAQRYGSLEVGRRGGVVAKAAPVISLVP